MAILPSRPSIPKDLKDPNAMAKYQEDMFNYQFAVQTLKHVQDEEESTRANLEKATHDVMMNIASNLK